MAVAPIPVQRAGAARLTSARAQVTGYGREAPAEGGPRLTAPPSFLSCLSWFKSLGSAAPQTCPTLIAWSRQTASEMQAPAVSAVESLG